MTSAVTLTAAPRPADACPPDPCYESNRFTHFEVVSTIVAPDGVLRIDARQNGYPSASPQEALAFVQVFVIGDGMLAEGALEYQPETRAFVWRPATPLTPNGTYGIVVVVDNDELAQSLDEEWIVEESWCGEDIENEATVHVSGSMLPELAIPDPDFESSHHVEPIERLSTLVCCDGAYPTELATSCIDDPIEISWGTGHCASRQGRGTVRAVESFKDDVFPVHVAGDLALTLRQTDGSWIGRSAPGQLAASIEHNEPFCARLEVVSLATGEQRTGPEHCYGDDLVDQLSFHDIDPSEGLAACQTQAYICEIEQNTWDPDNCEPWTAPPGEDDTGTAGSTNGDPDGNDDPNDPAGTSNGDNATGGVDTTPQDGDDGLIDPAGCACRTRGDDSTPTGSWLLVAGLWWLRRRRPAMPAHRP
ncbi:MAG: MYXO-CTERM sorting domain-containing protein [Myxococcota bacterium]